MSAGSVSGLTLAGEPRVQLLPPTVKEREKSRAARRLMGLLIVLAVVVAGAGTAFAFLLTTQAEAQLATEQARTLDILAQQSQYSEGARVAAQVAATEEARRAVTAGEVDWLALTTDVLSYLPCDCATVEIGITGPAPWEPAIIPAGPLRAGGVAALTLTVSSANYTDAAAFVAAVRKMEGLSDAIITAATRDGETYQTEIVLTFDTAVLTQRYAPADATDDATPDDGATGDAAQQPTPTPTEGVVP